MTTKEFMSKAMNYYNKAYTTHQSIVIENHLNTINDNIKSDILLQIIKTFSLRYRCPPGVSEIVEAKENVSSMISFKQQSNKYCRKCGTQIYSDFCPNCDEYPDTEYYKDLFKNLDNNEEESK